MQSRPTESAQRTAAARHRPHHCPGGDGPHRRRRVVALPVLLAELLGGADADHVE